MSAVYFPQTSSPIPFLELKGDQQQHSFQVFGHLHHDLATSNNSSFSYNCHTSEEILSLDYSSHSQEKVIEKLVVSHEKASDHYGQGQTCSSWLQSRVGDSYNLEEEPKIESVNYNDQKYSMNWKPSKVRIMQKMMGTSKKPGHVSSKRQSSDGIRVCTDCHTTTTPLWRSGPQGPKSLCNACGIRQRKARRAAMAAAAAAGGAGFGNDATVTSTLPVEDPKPKVQVMKPAERGLDHNDKGHTLPLKKRSKIIDASRNNYCTQNGSHHNSKKLCFEDFALSSNKDYLKANTKLTKRSFSRDEEEGAILLMALSYGLACSS